MNDTADLPVSAGESLSELPTILYIEDVVKIDLL